MEKRDLHFQLGKYGKVVSLPALGNDIEINV